MFDYHSYWSEQGEAKTNSLHDAQIPYLVSIVDNLNPVSILEVGAGWGRVTKELIKIVPDYSVNDLSRTRLELIPFKIPKLWGDFMDLNLKKYDCIIAIEVLMHIPPELINKFVTKIKSKANHIITLDYDPKNKIELAQHNFLHDYDKLFPKAKVIKVNDLQKIRVYTKDSS